MVRSAKIPDFSLYKQVRGLHDEFIAMQKEIMSGDLIERARDRAEFYGRYGELELYGELLTRFPVLLDYLALEDNRR